MIARVTSIVAAVVMLTTDGAVGAAGARFYPDDPVWVDDDAALDASSVVAIEDANSYDFVVNTFASPGERRDVRALNVNTLDEVPDSSWFTNRIGRAAMSTRDIVRGPDRVESVALDGWVLSGGKATGLQPGFRMTDPAGQMYQIEFDPPAHPEMATGAEIIGTAFYHAFGYHTVDVYLAELDPARIVISDKATQFDPRLGERRPFSRSDLAAVLRRAARQPNGKYRVVVSRFAEGRPLGNFRYYGTRPDDPNDVIPHEHRRELRGARVFGAWLNHDDSRGVNSLDMLVQQNGRSHIKHYMFDFGSIMGSGTVFAQRHRSGNEYILEWKPGWLTLATLGLYTRPWTHISYPDVPPAVGRFEAAAFEPEAWKPEYPNAAFDNMRPDDALWAARIVARFDAPAIRAVVEKARFSDPRTADYLVGVLLERRAKVLSTWLTRVNPVVDFALSEAGELAFDNAALQAGVAPAEIGYRIQWARFDNMTGTSSAIAGESTSNGSRVQVPRAVIDGIPPTGFLEVRVSAVHPGFPQWAPPVTVHFQRSGTGWKLVGLARQSEGEN